MTDYAKGQWKVECDRCGFDYKSGQLRKEWQGLMTCYGPGTNGCHEDRHPQDFVRAKPDRQAVAWTRPPSEVVTITATDVTADDL